MLASDIKDISDIFDACVCHLGLPILLGFVVFDLFERECLPSERQVLSQDFKKSENAESFERNCQVSLFLLKPCLHLTFQDREYGREQSLSFTDR